MVTWCYLKTHYMINPPRAHPSTLSASAGLLAAGSHKHLRSCDGASFLLATALVKATPLVVSLDGACLLDIYGADLCIDQKAQAQIDPGSVPVGLGCYALVSLLKGAGTLSEY